MSRVEIGELRSELAKDLKKSIDSIINMPKMKKKRRYYLFVNTLKDKEHYEIRTTIAIMDKKPPKLLGTMGFLIDNKLGFMGITHALPYNDNFDALTEKADEVIVGVAEAAKNMNAPIIEV
jgi:hypothetical protein|tara:strand:+ start:1675 stop:2037 length:363 start_codon:yes stop_codon:yes gene_type:complete